nr:HNH endonuclease family protein [Actinomycetota bacterium]
CDTRNDILRRDLTRKVVVDCVVLSGILDDPYSGERVVFTRGPVTSLEVQIDHVVAMANAWQTGAKFWSDDKRERFANDRRNLLAVRGDLNLQKSDADAATWLPPRKAFRCTYVAMQVLTKDRYGLWLTAPEKAAITRILQNC